MSFKPDPNRPIYLQIVEEIKKRTVREHYTAGSRLPSVRELARELKVNPNTVARVYQELEREGFIETRRGQGSFITGNSGKIDKERDRLADVAAQRFVQEIGDIDLHNGHRMKLIEDISKKLLDT